MFLQRSPDTASNEDLRLFQLHLTANRVGASTINGTVTALRFFFTVTLDRTDVIKHLTFVPEPRKIPVILSPEEVARFLEAAPGVKYKAAFSVAYGAGLRVSEVAALKVSDVDSERMTDFFSYPCPPPSSSPLLPPSPTPSLLPPHLPYDPLYPPTISLSARKDAPPPLPPIHSLHHPFPSRLPPSSSYTRPSSSHPYPHLDPLHILRSARPPPSYCRTTAIDATPPRIFLHADTLPPHSLLPSLGRPPPLPKLSTKTRLTSYPLPLSPPPSPCGLYPTPPISPLPTNLTRNLKTIRRPQSDDLPIIPSPLPNCTASATAANRLPAHRSPHTDSTDTSFDATRPPLPPSATSGATPPCRSMRINHDATPPRQRCRHALPTHLRLAHPKPSLLRPVIPQPIPKPQCEKPTP